VDRRQRGQLTSGLLLITIGLIFLAGQIGWLAGFSFGHLWPLLLVVFGAVKFLVPDEDPRKGDGRAGGAWIMFVGALFLLHNYRVLRLDQSWPLFIVAAGVAILLSRDGRRGTSPDATPPGEGAQ